MQKWVKRTLISVGAFILCIAVMIGISVFDLWYTNNYKSHIQTVEVSEKKIQLVLLNDMAGFGDPAWYVYQLPLGTELPKRIQTAHNKEGVLFWNYSEAGYNCGNPKIEVLKNNYLVFSRGGFYHSLYNLESKAVIVNDISPWNSYMWSERSQNPSGYPPSQEEMDKGMRLFVQKNLHSKIVNVLNNVP